MPRKARLIAPGVAHHITQRGVNRQLVFFTKQDRRVYLQLLKENSRQAGLSILAYCLMSNHIHLVVIPEHEDSLALAMQRTHGRYAQYLNVRRKRSGHLWQNRYFSCPLDQHHLWTALRYVERNPIRAGMVAIPEAYAWSSAAAHLSGSDTLHILNQEFWQSAATAAGWREMIGDAEDEQVIHQLRKATYAGKPLGKGGFCNEFSSQAANGTPSADGV